MLPTQSTRLAYLCSPTDVFVIQDDAHEAMLANYKKGGLLKMFINLVRLAFPKVRLLKLVLCC
jgi:hypothetical protein